MKVYISKYRYHWISPYLILEKVCFWEKDNGVFYNHEEKPGNKYDKWVNFLQPICKGLQTFLDFVHPKIDYVKVDKWDTWSMDHTLGMIALPMLKQLQLSKHGAPNVDDEDVPEELKSTSAPAKENEWDVDGNHFKRWDWVMNEMIFAFEHHLDTKWEEAYSKGKWSTKSEACEWDENKKPKMFKMVYKDDHTHETDYEALKVVHERIANGFKLFGKYYRNLWD